MERPLILNIEKSFSYPFNFYLNFYFILMNAFQSNEKKLDCLQTCCCNWVMNFKYLPYFAPIIQACESF